jgi:hypothetical protein
MSAQYSTASNNRREAFYFSQDFISWVAEENKGAEREEEKSDLDGHR